MLSRFFTPIYLTPLSFNPHSFTSLEDSTWRRPKAYPGRGFRVNFCKKCGECGENKYFTAFLTKIHRKIHRVSYKNSPHRLLWQINVRNAMKAVNAVKKNNSPHFTAFLTKIHRKIHRISYKNSSHLISKVYSIWFKFARNFKDLSDSWRSGLSCWRHAGGQRFDPCGVDSFL